MYFEYSAGEMALPSVFNEKRAKYVSGWSDRVNDVVVLTESGQVRMQNKCVRLLSQHSGVFFGGLRIFCWAESSRFFRAGLCTFNSSTVMHISGSCGGRAAFSGAIR